MKIAIVGIGYVGLPLSVQFARSCVSVLGLDVDAKKVQLLNSEATASCSRLVRS
jgi:UDP-N-acetyl-D-glucosamine dehydrogenase